MERFDSAKTNDGWTVVRDGQIIASLDTQEEAEEWAVDAARSIYEKGGLTHVVFHTINGTIKEERFFGQVQRQTPCWG